MNGNDSDTDLAQQLRNLDREQITQLLDRYEEFEGSEYHRCHFCDATRPSLPFITQSIVITTMIMHEPTCVGATMIRILDRL